MSVKKDMLNGVFWNVIAKYSGIAISIIISAILARLIPPEEFGIIAIATVFINLISLFTDMGIGPAVIQSNQLNDDDYDNLFTFTLYSGITLTAIAVIFSPVFAKLYRNEELKIIVCILSVPLFFSCLNVLPNSLMSKHKKFRQIAIRSLLFQIIGGIIGVGMAIAGYGVYSLVIPPVIASVGMFFYNFLYYPRKCVLFPKINSIKKIASFSVYQFLFSLINYFSRNTDKLIIGRYMDMKSLGYYEKSYRLMLLPLENVTSVINPVIVPVLSHLQDQRAEVARKQEKLIQYISIFSFPIGILLHFTASEVIGIYYGPNWEAAVPVFSILALSIPLQLILSTTGSFYQCIGKTKHLFYNGICNTVCTVAGFLLAAKFWGTLEAIAYSWVITLIINFFLSYTIMYKFSLKCNVKCLFLSMNKSIMNFIISYIVMYVISRNATTLTDSLWMSLLIKSFVWAILTLFLIQITKQYNLKFLFSSIYGKVRHKTHSKQ